MHQKHERRAFFISENNYPDYKENYADCDNDRTKHLTARLRRCFRLIFRLCIILFFIAGYDLIIDRPVKKIIFSIAVPIVHDTASLY